MDTFGYYCQDETQFCPNPLLVDVILRNLAKYIPRNKDLLNFRQVSTIWNEAAQSHLNFDNTISLNSNSNGIGNSRIPTISDFNKIWQNEERWMDMPFYRFRFEMMEDSVVLDPEVREFFHCYGSQLKDLEVSFAGPSSGTGRTDECYEFLENLISIQARQLERVYILGENLLRILKLEGSNLHLVICFEPNENMDGLKKALDRIFNIFVFLFRKYSKQIQNLLISIRISHECEATQKYHYNSLARKFVCDLMGTEIPNLNLKGFQLTCDNWEAINGIESSLTKFLVEQRRIIEYFSIAGKVEDSFFDKLGLHYFPKLVVLDIEDRSYDETQTIKRRLTRTRC